MNTSLMNDPAPGPPGVGPVHSLSSLSDLSEAISDMSLSTSPGSDIPPIQSKVAGSSASPSNEVFEEVESRPRKRLVMRQLSSNPYLASSEMSPDDFSHSLIIGSNSYAGGESSSERFNTIYTSEDIEASSSKVYDIRANSYPLAADFFGDIESDSEDKDENKRDSDVPFHDHSNSATDPSGSFNKNSSHNSTNTNVSKNYSPRSENAISSSSVGKPQEDSHTVFISHLHGSKQYDPSSEHLHSQSHLPSNSPSSQPQSYNESSHHVHHQYISNHIASDEHFSKCNAPVSSSCPSFPNQLSSFSQPQDGHTRHHSSGNYSSQPQSREINSWGHFYKQNESHYKYRRSHYNSSDSEEENFNLYRPPSKPAPILIPKSHQVNHNHRHKSPVQAFVSSKERVKKNHNHISLDSKSSNVVGVKPQVFRDRFQVVKRWFSDCNDGQKNIILKGLLNLCELPQLHLLSVHMSGELHQGCPSNCEDILTWLPTNLATKVMTYLDPVSLCRAAQVCRVWRQLAEDQSLWRRFCCQTKWRLSKAAEHKQVISHMSPEGSIQWKNVFAERFRLRNNWLRGRCTVRTFEGHLQGISCVQFDDSRIVSGSSDKTIKVWNMRTNAPWSVQTLMGHHGTVRCLHLDGNCLVSGSCDTTIKVWDLSTQESWSSIACKVTMTGHTETVRCLQADDDKVVSGSYDKTLKIWDIKSGQLRRTLRGHNGSVLCVHFSETKIVSGSKDKTIKLWNYDGHCMMTLRGHQDAVTCLMFDSTRIVSGSLDHNLKFWDVHSGECLNTIDWKKAEGHTGVVRCLQADSWRVVSAADDKTIKVWNLATGERLVTLRNHTDGVTCLQFNDFIIVSGSYDKSVKLWDFTCC